MGIDNIPKGLILGASSGIGQQLANEVKFDSRFDGVEWSTPDISECDVADEASLEKYIRENGPFSYMAYCPGVNRLQWIEETSAASIGYTYDVNVTGFILMLAKHELYFPGASGSIVAISSDASRIPMRTSIAYCSSKAALNMAVRVAARELAPRWQINAVAPGIIADTKMTEYIDSEVPRIRGWDPAKAQAYEQSMIPVGRRGFKSEIAQVMRDLLRSPKYLTGSIVEISGGK